MRHPIRPLSALVVATAVAVGPLVGPAQARMPESPPTATAPSVSALASYPVLQLGSRGESVKLLQRKLGGLTVDGSFGRATLTRLKAWQNLHGLPTDGIVHEVDWQVLLSYGTPKVWMTSGYLRPVTTLTPAPTSATLRPGWNGVKVRAVQLALGLGSRWETMDTTTVNAVKRFQASRGLTANGVVGLATWRKLLPNAPWQMDRYQVKPKLTLSATRAQRVSTLISYARAQKGSSYTWGGAGPSWRGFDCSGLVLQAMYAAGLDPQPINVVAHTGPIYRTSQEIYAHRGLRHVPVSQRRAGDLVFYHDRNLIIRHVAVYTGNGMMVEAVKAGVRERPLYFSYGDGGALAPYVVRPFA